MKPPDFHKILFPLNVAVTGLVFILLAPTVRIYRGWFPEKKDLLWLFPFSVLMLSSLVWFLASLSLPLLIRKGIFEDRRLAPRPAPDTLHRHFFRQFMPIAVFLIHALVLLLLSAALVDFMKTNPLERLLVNLP